MKNNSNQQKQPLSLRAKREQFRSQIRRQQLYDFFAAKRKQIYNKQTKNQQIYKKYQDLNEEIQNQYNNAYILQQIERKIRNLIRQFPQQQWNMMLIGNYLIANPYQIFNFQQFIYNQCHQNQKLNETLLWSFCAYLRALEQISKQKDCILNIQRADYFLANLIDKFWNQFKEKQNYRRIVQYIFIALNILIQVQQQLSSFFPIRSFSSFINNLEQFYKQVSTQQNASIRSLKINVSQFLIQSIEKMKSKEIFRDKSIVCFQDQQTKYCISNQKLAIQNLIKCASTVFYDNIIDSSDLRVNCLNCITILCQKYPFECGDYLFNKKMIIQIIYLMVNHIAKTAQTILRGFTHIINKISNHQLVQFLNASFHINLVVVLNNLIKENGDNQVLYLTLNSINVLLQKVQQMDEKMFQNIFKMMLNAQLHEILEYIGTKRYPQKVQTAYAELVDNYFQQQEENYIDNSMEVYRSNLNTYEDNNLNAFKNQNLFQVQRNSYNTYEQNEMQI